MKSRKQQFHEQGYWHRITDDPRCRMFRYTFYDKDDVQVGKLDIPDIYNRDHTEVRRRLEEYFDVLMSTLGIKDETPPLKKRKFLGVAIKRSRASGYSTWSKGWDTRDQTRAKKEMAEAEEAYRQERKIQCMAYQAMRDGSINWEKL